jgi:hypothetical protein
MQRPLPVGVLCAAALYAAGDEVGSRACAGCHAEIYRKYLTTGMARSAGAVDKAESWQNAAFAHAGIRYGVTPDERGYRMEFDGRGAKGERLLEWFVGSGALGRSYLFSADGFLYQAPVSYYASAKSWRISPGYENKRGIELTRAIETACLQCHASRLQPVARTQNRFASPPFLEGGVSCERCHGSGQQHVANRSAGRHAAGDIVNPARLPAEARDSVCAQCHLTGAARVARKSGAYRPGEHLGNSLAVFVWSGGGSELTATSHYERLHNSRCKRASGGKLWCGTCHDPHAVEEQPSYRERCLSCHRTKGCTEAPAVRQAARDDCAGCHMPESESRMVEHVAFTDHGIVRRKPASVPLAGDRKLVSFWPGAGDRDLALGYAIVAMAEPAVRREALEKLEAAESHDPKDVPVLAQLAQFYDRLGREEQAAALCERILSLDPAHIAAAVNLGIYRIKQGAAGEAVRLWEGALERNPALTGARVNLAVARFRAGQTAEAEAQLVKALEYDPGSELARKLLSEVRAARR